MPDNASTKSNSREMTDSPRPGFLKRHPLVTYFVLTYVIGWLIWGILGVAPAQGLLNLRIPPNILLGLGAFGPIVAAFIVTGITGGATSIRELVGRMFRWRVGTRWVLIALFGPATLFGLAAIILRIAGGVWPDISQNIAFPELGWGVVWLIFAFFAMLEEPGWRGLALPRLQEHRSALSATLILGVFWALWHLPLQWFHPAFMETGMVGFGFQFVSLLALSIPLTWLYNSAHGSILMAALLHAGLNTATMAGAEFAMLVGTFVIIAAIIIVVVFRRANLSRSAKQTVPIQ